MSIPRASSTCILFISLTQLVIGTQLLNITYLVLLHTAVAIPVFGTVIVPLTCMYASL